MRGLLRSISVSQQNSFLCTLRVLISTRDIFLSVGLLLPLIKVAHSFKLKRLSFRQDGPSSTTFVTAIANLTYIGAKTGVEPATFDLASRCSTD